MHDKYKRKHQSPAGNDRLRRQIALEAARRMYEAIGPAAGDDPGRLRDASEAEYYAAKRKAAAVLGHRVRPGDLPSDSEVRDQVLILSRSRDGAPASSPPDGPAADEDESVAVMADHLDRFAIYKMRLEPLERVKQNPRRHPEGDALFHSLQVFELAREARPYDEEFLLAALLHDVGKAVDPQDHVPATIEALRGAVTERTLWLIAQHRDHADPRDRPPSARSRRSPDPAEDLDDLELLRELDAVGRVPGATVGTIDEALGYLQALEREEYLDP